MYQVGMYGGTFHPLHQGHVRCIIQAANMCNELHIILSHGTNRGEIDIRVRYRWLYSVTKHIGNVTIHMISDDAPTKEEYTEEYWQADADHIKKQIGKPIDVVFCGDDYKTGDNFYKRCYPESELYYFERDEISSTRIRSNPLRYWEDLPQVVRPYYVKKILLVGGESVGKSTLTINLANYFNTNYLEEVGRDISEKSGTDMLMLAEDFTEILLTHKLKEMELIQNSNRYLFEDTDCHITKFYIRFLDDTKEAKHKNERLADAISALNSYDLVLFLEPDVEFVQDGDRSETIKNDREKYSNQIKDILKEANISYVSICGDYQQRFLQAIHHVKQLS